MKMYLRITGITAVILVAIAATAILPKQIAQGAILCAVLLCGIWNGIRFIMKHKEFFKSKNLVKVMKADEEQNKTAEKTQDDYLKYAVFQLSHRITDKLHSAYPDSSWQWTEKPSFQLFITGGHIRIMTMQTEEFNEADVQIDSIGRIGIQMLKSSPIEEIITANSENAETDFTVDPAVWYEQRGRKLLFDVITDLNAQGTKSVRIDESGRVTLADSSEVAKLEAFPTKNLWIKLIELLNGDQLKTVEVEDSIELSW